MKNWTEDEEYDHIYYKIKKINSTYYRLEAHLEVNKKSFKTYFQASSGKKRRDLKNFEPDNLKRDGGVPALMWMKKEILEFYTFCNLIYKCDECEKLFIYIAWADTKRKNVYSRLLKEGFYFMRDEDVNYLIKKVELCTE